MAGAAGYRIRLRRSDDTEWGRSLPEPPQEFLTQPAMKKKNLDKKATYYCQVRPVFRHAGGELEEGPWSATSSKMILSSTLTIATYNIGGSGLPSFIAKVLATKKNPEIRAADVVAELMNTHGIDALCLQELKGDADEWAAFRTGKAKGNKGSILLELSDMPGFQLFAAYDGGGDVNGNVGMIVRKSLGVSEGSVKRSLPDFRCGEKCPWLGAKDKFEHENNEGRYIEVHLGGGTAVLMSVYAHACSSSHAVNAQKNFLYRQHYLHCLEERVTVLKNAGKQVVVCGDLNATGELLSMLDCGELPFCRHTYYSKGPVDLDDEATKAFFYAWHGKHREGKRLLTPSHFNRCSAGPERCAAMICDYIKRTHNVDLVRPSSAPGALRMSGCEASCSVPCHSQDHASRAASDSCTAVFPFPQAALLVYSSVAASDHILVKVQVKLAGV